MSTVSALTRGDAARCVARFGYEPRTVGVPLLPPDAGEAAWLAKRRTMLTASEVAAVLGRSGYDSPFSLWWRKQPDWPQTPRTLEQHIGHKLEPVIGELWAEGHPEAALFRTGAGLWGHHRHEWLGATPDYIGVFPTDVRPCTCRAEDEGGGHSHGCQAGTFTGVRIEPVECKSDEGGDEWGRAGTDEIPFHHLCQLVTQCMVLGADRGRLIRLASKRVTEYVVDLDQHIQLVGDILTAGQAFVTSLESGLPPDIDGHPATTDALSALYSDVDKGTEEVIPDELAAVYAEAQATHDAWKARLNDAKNRIRERLGRTRAQYAVKSDGTRVASRSVFTRQAHQVAESKVDMIRVAKPRKAKP